MAYHLQASTGLRQAALLLAFLVTSAAVTQARAQNYPTRAVKIIAPFAPGGSADVFGRFIAQRLQDSVGQSFVIDNRPGGGSVIGTDAVAKSAPDGYTLLLMSNTHTVNESLIPRPDPAACPMPLRAPCGHRALDCQRTRSQDRPGRLIARSTYRKIPLDA